MNHAPRLLQLALCLTLASLLTPAIAHEDGSHDPPPKMEVAEQHKPTVLPDRVVLTWSGDPRHTQDVSWRTSSDVKQSFVEFAVATEGPYFVENAQRINATTAPFDSDLGTYHLHTAQIRALAPSTKYAYRVGDGNNWSEWFHFTTASNQQTPFSFIYFGDAQNDVRSMWSRIIREAQADAPRAAFMLHAGDLVNVANRDNEWGEWFGGGHWLNAMMPSIATPGNHEYSKKTVEVDGEKKTTRTLSRHWQPTFSFPQNGPEGLKESVYWIDYNGVRFISLNSNEQHEIQAEWVKQVLKANPHRWTIVTFHHPMYSSAKGRDNVELRKLWKPIFDEHRVDLVLQGHDHSYARTGLELPETAENLSTGVSVKEGPTVYVVSVSGPKQYDVGEREFFHRSASGAQLYQIIHIDGDELHFEARVANGELYDAFSLRKVEGKFNRLRDDVPESPEFRKPATIRVKKPEPTSEEVKSDEPDKAAPKQANRDASGGPRGRRGRNGGGFNPNAIFENFDKDQDGKLAGEEIPDRMRSRLKSIDTDNDGSVSLAELKSSFARRSSNP